MSDINFFNDDQPIEEAFKNVAKRLNARLNQRMRDEMGKLLCECADKRDFEGFKFLITRYPDQINARDNDNDTPLILAANMGSEKITELALQHPDVDINAVGAEGMTAFMHVCDQNYTDIGKLFLARPELDVTVKDEDGDTALILAVQSENSELVRLILERDGVNVEDKDIEGGSARSIAEAFKGDTFDQKEILELIKAHKSYAIKAQARNAAAEAGAQKNPVPVDKDSSDNRFSGIKTPALFRLAESNPYAHSLAFLRWADQNKQGVKLRGKSKYQAFVKNPDALYGDSTTRTAYDPQALAICKEIGYDPAVDYPLVSAESGATSAPSSDPS